MSSGQPTLKDDSRLAALEKYDILDTLPELAFDDITALAAQICETPVAMISLIDKNRQWFKAKIGIDMSETPRKIAFCDHAIQYQDLFIVPDATKDSRFKDNPLVTSKPNICFYAGIPLVNPEGVVIGTLCVIDHKPRTLTYMQEQALRMLGRQVIMLLELRRMARELIESESKFRTLTDNITDVLWIISPDLKKVYYVSPGYEKIWGRTVTDLYTNSQDWINTILSDDRKYVLENLEKLKENKSINIEYRITRADGEIRWVHSRGFPVQDSKGDLVRLTGIATDITDNKLAEIDASRLGAIVEYSDDAIIGKDLNGIITSWNKGAEKIFGYTAIEMVGTSITRLIPNDRLDEENLILGKIKNGESVEHFETQRLTRDGRLIDISVMISPIKDATTGKPVGISKVARNITDRKRAEEKIAEQAALLDKAHDAIVVRDLEGTILFWNKGAENLYGWTRQEALGRNIGELLYADSDQFKNFNKQMISQGQLSCEMHQITKDKSKLIIEARWTLIRDNHGQPKTVLAINTDITEKKKIEVQFMRAQRMESIGILAGGIAHDLNNILAPILMSIDILKTLSNNSEAIEILDAIDVSAKRGADIVRQVLSFARGLEGARIEIQPKHLLKDLENIIRNTFPKNIDLQFSFPNDIRTIMGDPTQLHQVLMNLCVNARDAMPNGGNLIISAKNCELDAQYVAMNSLAKPGHYVNITVTDSGTGIPQNILDKIFEPFFTTKEIGKGTGLGLSTVSAIVKSHEGIINVYSEPGKGTSFKLYLPATSMDSKEQTEVPVQVSLPRGNGETILVIDDEASILSIITQTLHAFGYQVLTAKDGAVAVAVYAEHKKEIAVVITDMMMPIMDGEATVHALMQLNPAVKIIATSGLSTNGDAARLSKIGVKHFLTKPFTAESLLKTLKGVLV